MTTLERQSSPLTKVCYHFYKMKTVIILFPEICNRLEQCGRYHITLYHICMGVLKLNKGHIPHIATKTYICYVFSVDGVTIICYYYNLIYKYMIDKYFVLTSFSKHMLFSYTSTSTRTFL